MKYCFSGVYYTTLHVPVAGPPYKLVGEDAPVFFLAYQRHIAPYVLGKYITLMWDWVLYNLRC